MIVRLWPNTNTNNIRSSKNDHIQIIFGFPKSSEYEYHLYICIEHKFLLVAFVWSISTMCFQMLPQIACLKGLKCAFVTFVWFFSTVGFTMLTQRAWIRSACQSGCKFTLVAFVWIFSTVTLQMGLQNNCPTGWNVTLATYVWLLTTVYF